MKDYIPREETIAEIKKILAEGKVPDSRTDEQKLMDLKLSARHVHVLKLWMAGLTLQQIANKTPGMTKIPPSTWMKGREIGDPVIKERVRQMKIKAFRQLRQPRNHVIFDSKKMNHAIYGDPI